MDLLYHFSNRYTATKTARNVTSTYGLFSVADFEPWSTYGDCMCDLHKYRSRVCVEEPCVGETLESQPCDCVPLEPAGTEYMDFDQLPSAQDSFQTKCVH